MGEKKYILVKLCQVHPCNVKINPFAMASIFSRLLLSAFHVSDDLHYPGTKDHLVVEGENITPAESLFIFTLFFNRSNYSSVMDKLVDIL